MSRAARHGTYTDVAGEYYDAIRHPTCANFRSASGAIVRSWLRDQEARAVCDVGAGKSLVAEILAERGAGLEGITLLDSAPEMLAYSDEWISRGATAIAGSAEAMPFPDSAFDVLVGSLGDPFNRVVFWREAARVLRPGGQLIFTTPAFEWASSFRARNLEPSDAAEFVLSDGRHLLLPSLVLDERAQIGMITDAGLSVIGVYHVLLAALKDEPVSQKLKIPGDVPFVTGYLASSE